MKKTKKNKRYYSETESRIIRDGSHVHIDTGEGTLSKDFKTSGSK